MVTPDAPDPFWFLCYRTSDRTLELQHVFSNRVAAINVARNLNGAWGSEASLPDPNRHPLQVRWFVVSAREVQECPTIIYGLPAAIRIDLGLPAPFAD